MLDPDNTTGDLTLSSDGNTMTWRLSFSLPDCPHPIDQQVVTKKGVACEACGKLQKPYDDSETDGIEP